ncbi:MAG: hypothetical protein JNM17_38370 [Archangium sp.]|nr:hypothetical protein [Archangium sp.]
MPCGALLELGWLLVRKNVKKEDEVSESDHLEIDVRLLPILESDRLHEILREELAKRGWELQPDGSMQKPFGDGIATIEKDSSTIRLVVKEKQKVEAEAEATGRAKEEDKAAQQAVEDKAAAEAQQKLDTRKAIAKQEMIRKNLEKLEKVQEQLQKEVDDVSGATTKRSLLERAQQLGTVESVTERKVGSTNELIIVAVKT